MSTAQDRPVRGPAPRCRTAKPRSSPDRTNSAWQDQPAGAANIRAGFDDDITDLLVPLDRDIRMSSEELGRRLRPLGKPGYATAYDNQGFGVIGLILSRPISAGDERATDRR